MASQVSPGIVLKERDLSNAVIVGASTITAGVASTFQRGPIGKPTRISSQKELLAIFGAPAEENAEDWFVASEFLNYGGRLNVVRAATGVNSATDGGASVVVKNDEDWEAGNGNGNFLVARSAGTWANDLKVVFVDRGADQYVTLSASPASIAMGDTLTFVGGKTGTVYSWDAASNTAAVILDDPSTRLTTSDALDSPEIGIVATTSSLVGGTGYASATGVSLTGGSGTGATADITVSVGAPTAIAGGAGGSSYTTQNNLATTGGTGADLTVNVVATAGAVTSVTIATAGTGYTVGDVITIASGDSNAEFTISTVEGPVSAIAITSGGSGYVATDVLTVSGGGGDATAEVATVVDGSISVSSVRDWYTTTQIGSTGLTLSAIGPRPGTSAYAAARGIKYDELHVAVVDSDGGISGTAGTVIERMLYLSKLTDGKGAENQATYYKTAINSGSEYIYHGTTVVGAYAPASDDAGDAWGQASTDTGVSAFTLAGATSTDLSAGDSDYDYTSGEIVDAYNLFTEADTTDLAFVIMGGGMGSETDTKLKAGAVMGVAQGRKDCIAFVSPHRENQIAATGGALSRSLQKTQTINFFNTLASTSYAVFDSGYKYMYDRFNDVYRWIPCNGDVAGLCVSTSASTEDWYSPAGTNRGGLRNAVKLAFNPTQADRDELYQARINPIVSLPGSGTILFGDKTALASPSAFDRINVRRLFLAIQKRAEGLAKGVLFEQNDATTRVGFASALNSFLAEVQARRGVTDFLVICNETNNTASVIDRNEFVAEIYVKPTRSINYVTVTLTATKTGVSFSEVIGG